MKKNLFMVAAVALMAMVACNKEEVNNGGQQVTQEPSYYVEFTAQIDEDDASTKTAYDATNKKTKWTAGDLISVNGKKFKIKELADDGLSATFVNDEELGDNFREPFTAIYPYNATEGVAVVPSIQTVTYGTFADESVVTVAYSATGNSLSFRHVTSVVKFQVATEGVDELTFSSSVALAGTINVNANEGGEPTYEATEGSKTIKVKPASGTFSVGETYYVSVLPTVGEAGTKVDFAIKADNVTVKSGNVNFKRNKVMDAKSIEVKYIYLKPNSNWTKDNARFAIYAWNSSGDTWVDMEEVDGAMYRCILPFGYMDYKYVRLNPATTENNWNNGTKWNETSNLSFESEENLYTIADGAWDNGDGNFSNYNVVYLKPNSNWTQDNARFAIYAWNSSGNTWVDMIKAISNTSYYVAQMPDGYKDYKYVRLNPATTENNWNNGTKWNETSNLSFESEKNLYTIADGAWDNGSGSFTKYVATYQSMD